MHIVFLTVPASGQANVQLATAQPLIDEGHQVTFLSGQSLAKRVLKLQMKQSEKKRSAVNFISLGSDRAVEDFTPRIQDNIHNIRKVPGDFSSIVTCIKVALVSPEEHISTALKIRNLIIAIDPDMVVVDCLSPVFITGARLSNRGWLLTVPCSPGMTTVGGIFSPHPVAADRSGSWWTPLENAYLRLAEHRFRRQQPGMVTTQSYLRNTFGLKSFGTSTDTTLLPPYWEDTNCLGGIHFNVAGLTDSPSQPPSLVFVGAGIVKEEPSEKQCAVLNWMNDASDCNESVVYINMGSMFIWCQEEYSNCIKALCAVYQNMQGRVRFVLKNNKPRDSSLDYVTVKDLPPFILQTNWIESQHAVFQHSSLKVFVHHGGGNFFNEAVYFGVPQLILSQWLDTHELGQLAATFGFGLRSACPPHIEENDLYQKLLQLLGPNWNSFKSNASQWAARSKLGGGAGSAARIIQSYVESQRLTRGSTIDGKTG